MSKYKILCPLHDFQTHYIFPKKININSRISIVKINENFEETVYSDSFLSELISEYDKRIIENCEYAIQIYYNSKNEMDEMASKEISRVLMGIRLVKPLPVFTTTFVYKKHHNRYLIDNLQPPMKNENFGITGVSYEQLTLYKRDVSKLRKYIKFILDLYKAYEGKYHKVLNAAIFFETSYKSLQYKPRLILMTAALESLFNSERSEISYILGERMALLLGNNVRERKKIFHKVIEIYKIRSTFVHGGETDPEFIQDPNRTLKLLISVDDLCRTVLNIIIDKKMLKSFDSDSTVRSFFKKQVFK